MLCPECGESMKENVNICISCGEDISTREFDVLIDDILKEDDVVYKKLQNDDVNKGKTVEKNGKKTEDSKDELGRPVQIVRYVTGIVVLLLLFSMLFTWFGFGGRGTFKGFVPEQASAGYMTKETITLNLEQIEALDPTMEIVEFSPRDMYAYVKGYEDTYKVLTTSGGETKNSWAVMIQTVYIRGFVLLTILSLLAVAMLLADRKLKTIEWTRGIAVLSAVIIALNYLAFKIPFFSMFALRARSILREENPLTAVRMNMDGINVNNEFYPYHMVERNGFYFAVAAVVLWFILTTVLVEMKKDKEYNA